MRVLARAPSVSVHPPPSAPTNVNMFVIISHQRLSCRVVPSSPPCVLLTPHTTRVRVVAPPHTHHRTIVGKKRIQPILHNLAAHFFFSFCEHFEDLGCVFLSRSPLLLLSCSLFRFLFESAAAHTRFRTTSIHPFALHRILGRTGSRASSRSDFLAFSAWCPTLPVLVACSFDQSSRQPSRPSTTRAFPNQNGGFP